MLWHSIFFFTHKPQNFWGNAAGKLNVMDCIEKLFSHSLCMFSYVHTACGVPCFTSNTLPVLSNFTHPCQYHNLGWNLTMSINIKLIFKFKLNFSSTFCFAVKMNSAFVMWHGPTIQFVKMVSSTPSSATPMTIVCHQRPSQFELKTYKSASCHPAQV